VRKSDEAEELARVCDSAVIAIILARQTSPQKGNYGNLRLSDKAGNLSTNKVVIII
jgi:hypothetical protein